MSATTVPSRPARRPRSAASRRSGYVGAMVVNGVMLFLINAWPGWAVLPFLTPDMWLVLPWINASLMAAVFVNAVYLLADPRWLRALGSAVTGVIGLAATVRMWQVFPFDFGDSSGWDLVVRILLVVAIVGGMIGIIVAVVQFIRAVVRGDTDR